MIRVLIAAVLLALLAGCTTAPPSKPANLCAIFQEKSGWYKEARKAQNQWGTSIPVLMSTMYQESGYVADIKPPRRYYLGFIPGGRPSNAYGYSQALDDTWAVYKKQTGHSYAERDDFGDAIDFIGWYYQQSYQVDSIHRDDAYNLYLSYHEGHKGFLQQTQAGKTWLKGAAQQVSRRSQQYNTQLKTCVDELEKEASSWF